MKFVISSLELWDLAGDDTCMVRLHISVEAMKVLSSYV